MSIERSQVARCLLAAGSLGEMGIGVLGLAFPRIVGVLLDVELDQNGLLLTRMLAVAVLAIGFTWWNARKESDAVSRNAIGFLLYNFGIGALFVLRALEAPHPALPLLVGLLHLGAGLAFLVLVPRPRDASRP